jgi:hypothetical protein
LCLNGKKVCIICFCRWNGNFVPPLHGAFGYDYFLMVKYFRDAAEYLDTAGFVVSSRLLNCSLNPLLDWMINFSFGEYVF